LANTGIRLLNVLGDITWFAGYNSLDCAKSGK